MKADCRLILETSSDGKHLQLHFLQPVFGINSKVCTITKKIGEPILLKTSGKSRDPFTNFFFWLTLGLKNYVELAAVTGDNPSKARISFYRCTDRRGRERHFIYAMDPASDTGGAFVAYPEDFQTVMGQLAAIEATQGAGKTAL